MPNTADNATPVLSPAPGRLARLRRTLPAGRTLPEAEWQRRHRAIMLFLWANVPALAAYGLARGRGVGTVAALVGAVAVFAVLGMIPSGSRRARAAAVSVGLLTATAVLIDFADGSIEAHFEFFVVIAVLTLYEDWTPFCLAIAYVALHHGIVGALAPDAVYDHRSAVDDPWGWAAIHAAFIAAAGLAAVTAWRLNEDVRAENDRSLVRARESERRFKTAFEDAPMGMALVGLDGRFLAVNRPLCELLGRSEAWMLAHGFPDVTHPDEVARDLGQLEASVTGRLSRYEVEKRYLHADGHPIWIALSVALVYDDAGRPVHFITHVQDITERRRQAEELAHRAADLERSNAELEQFAYVASHDLSEPLRTVAGFVRLLGDRYKGRLDADADTFIEYSISGTQRMQGMIDDLLRYSRAGRPDDDLVPVDLNAVAEEARAALDQAIRETGAEVTIGELPKVRGDAGQLSQVLQNLLANALKFHRPGERPHVTISAERRGARCTIAVEDDGIGIDPAQADRVFGMFKRLHSREEYPGTGIGLAIARKIVERHRGKIWHETAPSRGSRFCFTLAPADVAAASVAAASALAEAARPERRGRPEAEPAGS